MNETPENSDPITLTIATPAGAYESEFLTDAETSALAQFVKCIGWFEFTSHAADDDEAHLVKQAVDKLQNVLSRSGYDPR